MQDLLKDNTQEILTTYGLDFRIEKIPMKAHRPIISVDNGGDLVNDVEIINTDMFGLLNTKSGNIINNVKEGYHVSQNDEIVELNDYDQNKYWKFVSSCIQLSEGLGEVEADDKIESINDLYKFGAEFQNEIIKLQTIVSPNEITTN